MSHSDWSAVLPDILREVTARWNLTVGEPFPHEGQAWVAPAGDDLVLKLGWQHPEAEHEADGLFVWQGNGAVYLHDSLELPGTSALLLERCLPGTTLHALPEPEQDLVVAGLLRRLWRPAGPPFRPLSEMCDLWAVGFARRSAGIDPGLVRLCLDLMHTLPRNTERNLLLCTDLHAGNILAAAREPWLVIDPKPYVGDPAYDVTQHLLNCEARLQADPHALTARMADLLDLDPDRVRQWLLARCIVQSPERPTLLTIATRLAP